MGADPEPAGAGDGFPAGGVFKAAVDAVIVMSIDGIVADWNPAAERMFGYTHAEAVGRELAGTIIPPALRAQHRDGLARYRETGKSKIIDKRLALFGIDRRGSVIPIELTVTRIPDTQPPLFAGFIRARRGDRSASSTGG